MKNTIISTGIGAIAATVLTTVVSAGIVKSAQKKNSKRVAELVLENTKLKEELKLTEAELSGLKDKLEAFEERVKSSSELLEQIKADKVEIDIVKADIALEKSKLADARQEISDGVVALKNAMYCGNVATREDLIERNFERVMNIITRVDKEIEFYKIFGNHGRDFGWLEGNAAAVSKKLKETSADLESTLQLLGYEEKEKQLLRWCFAS